MVKALNKWRNKWELKICVTKTGRNELKDIRKNQLRILEIENIVPKIKNLIDWIESKLGTVMKKKMKWKIIPGSSPKT